MGVLPELRSEGGERMSMEDAWKKAERIYDLNGPNILYCASDIVDVYTNW